MLKYSYKFILFIPGFCDKIEDFVANLLELKTYYLGFWVLLDVENVNIVI